MSDPSQGGSSGGLRTAAPTPGAGVAEKASGVPTPASLSVPPQVNGDQKVAQALDLVASVEGLPVERHPQIYAEALRILNDTLSDSV